MSGEKDRKSERGVMIFTEVLRFFLHIGFHTFRRVRVYNYKVVPKEGPLFILPNHQGMVDMFMTGYKVKPVVHWMAKQELFKNKIFAAIIRGLGAYPVNREKGTAATKHTLRLIKEGKVVGIFPQGTRARKGKPVPKARSGAVKLAVETDTLVVPVAIWGNNRIFGKMHIRFGEPFKFPQPPEGEKYTNEQYQEMAAKLLEDIYAMRYTDKELAERLKTNGDNQS